MALFKCPTGVGGGGGSNVATGTFIVASGESSKTFDTGLSSISKITIIRLVTDKLYPPGLAFSYWDSSYPSYSVNTAVDVYGGGRNLGTAGYKSTSASITYGVMVTNVSDGEVTIAADQTNGWGTGTYIWYAE